MQTIKIKKGLNIPMKGGASLVISGIYKSDVYAIKPDDFIDVIPKLLVKPGDKIQAGDPLFFNKNNEKIIFTSPVSGIVLDPIRAEKRKIVEIPVKADTDIIYRKFEKQAIDSATADDIRSLLHVSGLWTFLRQRPFDIIPSVDSYPRDIYISTFDSSPLSPDYQFIIKDKIQYFQTGVNALAKLTKGNVCLGLDASIENNIFANIKNATLNYFKGIHPAGNVGLQIHKTKPINKGETIWYVNPQDVVMIGKLFEKGIYDAERIINISGQNAKSPTYIKTLIGAQINKIATSQNAEENSRFISGNVLTGVKILPDGFLGYYHHQLTIIPEGDYYEFAGWALPGISKFSNSRTFLSFLFPGKKFDFDTNFHGGNRPFVLSGQYEKVFPFNIYPVYLLKAILTEEIEKMEELGIYEVSEEDFALCDFVCTSKMETQQIIRKGLDIIRKEMS